MKNDIITTLQMKLKHLNYLPKPIHIDESRYDLVDDDEFFKRDNRMPLVMVTQFGIFPTKGQYTDKPKKDVRVLEGLENQTVGFFRRTYLGNTELKGIVMIYVDAHLVEKLIKDQNIFDKAFKQHPFNKLDGAENLTTHSG